MKRCRRCELWRFTPKPVSGRGDENPDVVLIGEAPGKSEVVLGRAFVGPAGRLLDDALAAAKKLLGGRLPRIWITNIVRCRPTNSYGGKNLTPTRSQIEACYPHLERELAALKPKGVVLMGRTAQNSYKSRLILAQKVPHPAYILRKGGRGSPEFRLFVTELAKFFKIILEDNDEILA